MMPEAIHAVGAVHRGNCRRDAARVSLAIPSFTYTRGSMSWIVGLLFVGCPMWSFCALLWWCVGDAVWGVRVAYRLAHVHCFLRTCGPGAARARDSGSC